MYLVSQARGNSNFCQRLYFLLRSYTATLEGERKSREVDASSHSLSGILQTLDLLQLAQEQLSCQLLEEADDQAEPVETPTRNGCDVKQVHEASVPSVTATESASSGPVANPLTKTSDGSDSKKTSSKKKKSMLRVFHKKATSSKQQKDFDGSARELAMLEKKKISSPRKAVSPKHTGKNVDSSPTSGVSVQQLQKPQSLAVSTLFDNMSLFLGELDGICDAIERSLLKSVSQKLADWALQPWSPTKETALAEVTELMRDGLRRATGAAQRMPLVNPVDSSELLVSVDSTECYILPSAHFPLLLTFDVQKNTSSRTETEHPDLRHKEERMYRTRVEIVALRGSASPVNSSKNGGGRAGSLDQGARSFYVEGAVAGSVK